MAAMDDSKLTTSSRWSINPNMNSRTVNTPGGATICNTLIPEGTDVMVSSHDIKNCTWMFGSDASEYNPERWIDVDEQKRRDMERSAMGFSWGRRVCMGQHLARILMKKMIASFITAFEVSCSSELNRLRLTLVNRSNLSMWETQESGMGTRLGLNWT